MMEKGLRNTFISIIATIIVTFSGAWVNINSRIVALETQADNDHQLFMDNNSKAQSDMKLINDKLDEINIKNIPVDTTPVSLDNLIIKI